MIRWRRRTPRRIVGRVTTASPDNPPPTLSATPTLSLAILACATFSSAASIRVSDPLLPQVAASFGTTAGEASAIVTAFTLAYGLMQIFYGAAGDRMGKVRLIAITTLLAAAGSLACALAPSLLALTVARFATAAVACAIIPLSFAWIGDVIPYARRQPVLARFITGQILGMIFGQVAGGILGDAFGWRWVFGALAIAYVVAGLVLLLHLRFDPLTRLRDSSGVPGLAGLVRSWRDTIGLLRDSWVRVILTAVAAEGFLFFGAFTYVGNELRHRFAIDYTIVGLAMTAYGGGGLVYTAGVGRLVQMLGEAGLARVGGTLLGTGFVVLVLAPALWVSVLAIALCGLGFFMLHNTLQTHGTQMAPKARGAGVAAFATALFLGQSLGVAIAAPIVDHIGATPVFLGAAIGMPLIGFALASSLRRAPHRR
ncbi:MFS transporter [Vineibacter terrae]|uniref:MFS transporter n=1 Tax=Vineibacter terrae TaxID=2586908 RepID=A0A5C8PN27_9HYPH|nr:MFS transporter [Vineibacter terrae]TXL75968.1 MFS transporter [Vineibacter terrae]